MSTFSHNRAADNDIHMLERQYRGKGLYYIRGLFQGVHVGDDIISHTQVSLSANRLMPLKVSEIISVSDSKSIQLAKGKEIDALVELICIDEFYPENTLIGYTPYSNFGG